MIKAYADGRDLYAVIASMSFDKPYEECLEFYPEGIEIIHEGKKIITGYKTHQNKAGKERRTFAKSILLGLLYGRGSASIAQQINKSKEEAQEIIDKFFKAFPSVKQWIDKTIENAHKNGYVEDIAGRRRRLPDILLPQYKIEFIDKSKTGTLFNPLLECDDKIDEASNKLIKKYETKCDKIKYSRDYDKIKDEALKEGIIIHNNNGFIAQAERQAVNCVDAETQILTLSGWKYYNEIKTGDRIMSFNADRQLIEEDTILDIYQYNQKIEAIRIKHNGLNCISTLNHKWPLYSRGTKKITFETTDYISRYKNYGTKKIIKSADNAFQSSCQLSDAELYILGILFTDGHIYNIPNTYENSNRYSCSIVQSTAKQHVFDKIEKNLSLAGIEYSKSPMLPKQEVAALSYTFYIHQPTSTRWGRMFPDKCLTYDFINTLSQAQAKIMLEGFIDGDGSYEKNSNGATIITTKENQVGVIQYLIIRSGHASTFSIIDCRGKKCYSDKINNKDGYIEIKNIYYAIRLHSRRYADVLAKNCSSETLDFAWCVRTNNSTWIARSGDGYTFITGNSRVQGGAASLTKNALIDIFNDQKLKDMGAYLINTVHDEILIEAPDKYMKEAADRLTEIMKISAKKYVPNVPMDCDPYITNAWYLDEFTVLVKSEFKKLLAEGLTEFEAFEKLCNLRKESTRSQIYEIVKGFMNGYIPENVDISYKSLTDVEDY